MKKFISDFLHRGFIAAGFGPIVLAVVYLVLHHTASVETLSVNQVCVGIFTITALAFAAGGLNALYQIERLPLIFAILIHGSVLYIGYLITYLLNDWLDRGMLPIIIFTVIFVVGFALIWAVIYSVIKRSTEKINKTLSQKQKDL